VTSLPAECCAGPKQMMYEGIPNFSPLPDHVNGIGGGSPSSYSVNLSIGLARDEKRKGLRPGRRRRDGGE
jgi:hypothetical protein